jgi:hypothetical protein
MNREVNDVYEAWGFIPMMLDHDDDRPAQEQFDAKYISGWRPVSGFTVTWDARENDLPPEVPVVPRLKYPGDPVMHPISVMVFRDQLIFLFPSAWVLVLDNAHDIAESEFSLKFSIARLD